MSNATSQNSNDQKSDSKKDFVAPELRRHENLPEITGITFGADG